MALVVFTGGARSGKSSFAARLALDRWNQAQGGGRLVAVVFGDGTDDAEMAGRIQRHRDDRDPAFVTLESATSREWTTQVDAEDVVLVDCLGTLLARAMDEARAEFGDADGEDPGLPDGFATDVSRRLGGVVGWLTSRAGDTVVVTNEVGDGVVPAYPSGRLFRDLLGGANRRLVAAADASYLCVCGRAVALHELPGRVRWPED